MIDEATRRGAESGSWGFRTEVLDVSAEAIVRLDAAHGSVGSLGIGGELVSDAAEKVGVSGYTARVAGTEKGVTEPKAVFSTCFGAPFLPLNPNVYAKMLGEKLATHKARVWLVNTGWTGGPYGVGKRMKIAHTRAMINAALAGQLDKAQYRTDPVFNLEVPTTCPGVPEEVLDPRKTWPDGKAYDEQAKKLAAMFADNFKRFEQDVPASVKAAGPKA